MTLQYQVPKFRFKGPSLGMILHRFTQPDVLETASTLLVPERLGGFLSPEETWPVTSI